MSTLKIAKPGDHIAIVGGGVIGALCGWYLQQAGCKITIVDRDRFGAACSHGNCGYVSPSHVLPLCQPGVISKTLGSLFRANSPIRIKPRMSSALISWMWNFVWSCNQKSMMRSARGRHELLQASKKEYVRLIDDHQIDCEWQDVGLLFVFDHSREFESFRKVNEMIHREFGVSATPHAGDELIELEPAIKPGFGGGWHYEGDCHLRPDKLMAQLQSRLLAGGATIVEGFELNQLIQNGSQVEAMSAEGHENISADHFVVATGAMTPLLNRHLGLNIPIQPGKGYSLTMPAPKRMPTIPIIFEDSHVAVTPLTSKYRIGSTMEFVGYDTSIKQKRIDVLKGAAKKYLHDPYCDPVEETWYGWRPMTWDGKPIIDRSPAASNLWIAAGHNMLGLSMGASTGKLVKELMLDEPAHIDPKHFAVSRFL